ncbi:MAG: 2-C-methyl-D-erythritol 4-phosphate cytidylyltransferase [Christensenellales bacterium]|jgi:2-C-methyl-D-erythritol 4-phosphate cytidylyltransferase/2-C-methyl-D-erythritol 2,4-cyclodiphosphate synthase
MGRTVGILLAAGNARRMGKNKMFMRIGNKSVLERSLDAFENSQCLDHIIIVCQKKDALKADAIAEHALTIPYTIVEGGSERQFSVGNALKSIDIADVIVVHDGARCFVRPGIVSACVKKAYETGAAAAGVRTKDTIKRIEGDMITGTVDRADLINIQTPQAFRYGILMDAYTKASSDQFVGTDECSLLERIGTPVSFVEAHYDNIKITTKEDILHGRFIVGEQIRTGIGYDAHRLGQGRPLILGGVNIPHTHGPLGHSDADVLLHAIIDALLGAAAAGDIGEHFPCTEEFCGISSITLLERTRDIVSGQGYGIVNIDATVVIEQPRLAAYLKTMIKNISYTLKIETDAVSVKATTTEGLGFEGELKGVSAMAVASLTR